MFPNATKPSIFAVNSSETHDGHSSARLGRLSLPGRNAIDTPNFFAITSRGVVPHLTPDVVSKHTSFGGVHMALEDFIEKAPFGTPPIMSLVMTRENTPLHIFTALSSSLVTLLAPRRTPAVSAPTGNSNYGISLFTSVGFQPITNLLYVDYVQKLRPDIVIGLADVAHGSLPGIKRIEKMGDRTSQWLDSLLLDLENSYGSNQPLTVFAPILPIDFHSQADFLHHISDDLADSISGLAFYSSSLLPDIPATTTVTRLIRLSLDEPASPHHILRQVSLGMDLFTIPFVGLATDAGLALTFRFSETLADRGPVNADAHIITEIKPLATDLSSSSYATSLTPLMARCKCYACTEHHCAYIHHLLSAKEMLGWVLLQIHNHHILSSFFSTIQESIRTGTFEVDKSNFERQYESDFPEGTGQRPRVRGYHFRSEGPGEKKRNNPAWGALRDENEEGRNTAALVPEESAQELVEKGFAESADL